MKANKPGEICYVYDEHNPIQYTDEEGSHCWCKMTYDKIPNSPWVYSFDYDDAAEPCPYRCAESCSDDFGVDQDVRTVHFSNGS